ALAGKGAGAPGDPLAPLAAAERGLDTATRELARAREAQMKEQRAAATAALQEADAALAAARRAGEGDADIATPLQACDRRVQELRARAASPLPGDLEAVAIAARAAARGAACLALGARLRAVRNLEALASGAAAAMLRPGGERLAEPVRK